jgi:hypothetical protein
MAIGPAPDKGRSRAAVARATDPVNAVTEKFIEIAAVCLRVDDRRTRAQK